MFQDKVSGDASHVRVGYQLTLLERVDIIMALGCALAAGPLPCGIISKILFAHSVLRTAALAIWSWMLLGKKASEIVMSKKVIKMLLSTTTTILNSSWACSHFPRNRTSVTLPADFKLG